MLELTTVQKIIVCVPPILLAVTLHEVAHGWMAKLHGDRTAEMLGRLSLNPIKHIDPVGTILLPALMVLTTGFIFGWAKPVPITFRNLRHPKKDMARVAIAGPGANLVMMIIWALFLKISLILPASMQWISHPLVFMAGVGIYINCILMVLNLLPIPPLDGSRILASYLPGPLALKFSQVEPYGLIILIALMFLGILGKILLPLIFLIIGLFSSLTGIDIFNVINILFR